MKRFYLEITNACNLNCPFCTNKKGQRFLSLEDIDNYTNQIKEFGDYIYLHVLGEPLLHPDFNEILDILDKKDFNLQLVTNGILLNKNPGLFNHKCLRKLSISLHSVNNIKIDDYYFKTIDEIIEKDSDTIIELRFYDLNNLDDNLKNYLNVLYNKYNVSNTKKNNSFRLKDNVYIYFEELFKWPDINDEYLGNKGKCHGIIDQLAILSNGLVTSCCLDSNGINAFGDLKKDSLRDILNSEIYLNALNDLRNNKLSLSLCGHCEYRLRFDHNNN